MSPELTPQDLQRLDLEKLIDYGRRALQTRDYDEAVAILREAARRAPFRQDLREWLAMAVETSLSAGAARQADGPPAQSTLAAMRLEPRGGIPQPEAPPRPAPPLPPAATGRAGGGTVMRRPEPEPPGVVMPESPAVDRFPRPAPGGGAARPLAGSAPREGAAFRPGFGERAPAGLGRADRGRPVDVKTSHYDVKPSRFEARHRRGPLSALIMGTLAGLVFLLLGAAGFGLYLTWKGGAGAGGDSTASMSAQENLIIEKARMYQRQGDYALAIEQINTLPEGPRRNKLLAGIHLEKGDLYFTKRQPPQLESALEEYKQAVACDPDNAVSGNALGRVYYTLALAKADDESEAARYLALARQTYEAVLQRHPDELQAMDGLGKVAIHQRNDQLAAQCWNRIVAIAPDSNEARNARNNLRSRGFTMTGPRETRR
ncbi:MAG: tetratricopeptide repeat protein [bacterium]|nr:tetratricopeptide repeat protein [bacterium]